MHLPPSLSFSLLFFFFGLSDEFVTRAGIFTSNSLQIANELVITVEVSLLTTTSGVIRFNGQEHP